MATAVQKKTKKKSRLDKESLQKKIERVVSRFRLGSHYTIERVAIVSGAAVVSGSLLFGSTIVYAVQAGNVDFSQTATYNTGFVSSRTNQSGELTGFWKNTEGTRAFAVIQFNIPSNMSTNAGDYFAYVTGVKDLGTSPKAADVSQATVGSIYSFGDGRIGLMLEAPEGFDMQVLNITMRAEKELVEVNSENLTSENMRAQGYDDSFITNDQWRIMLNPAAETLSTLPALSGDNIDLRELYWQTSTTETEVEIRQTLDTSLSRMNALLGRIDNYLEAMNSTSATIMGERVSLLPPVPHESIRGDRIEGLAGVDVAKRLVDDPTGRSIDGWEDKTDMAVAIDSSVSDTYEYNSYRLVTDHIFGGGYDFDWRSSTTLDGYVKDVVPGNQDALSWITDHAYQTKATWNANQMEWILSNGDRLEDHVLSEGAKPLIDLKNNLAQAYQDYFNEKQRYQRQLLQQLLISETQLDQAVENTQVAQGPDAVEFRF